MMKCEVRMAEYKLNDVKIKVPWKILRIAELGEIMLFY